MFKDLRFVLLRKRSTWGNRIPEKNPMVAVYGYKTQEAREGQIQSERKFLGNYCIASDLEYIHDEEYPCLDYYVAGLNRRFSYFFEAKLYLMYHSPKTQPKKVHFRFKVSTSVD